MSRKWEKLERQQNNVHYLRREDQEMEPTSDAPADISPTIISLPERSKPSPETVPQEYSIIQSGVRNTTKKYAKAHGDLLDEEPLIDTTALLAKNSKKTRRLVKHAQKKQAKGSLKITNFLQLPSELLLEVLINLRPSDVLHLSGINHELREFVFDNEAWIAKEIVQQRYSVLSKCFILPRPIHEVDEVSRAALIHPTRERMAEVHKKPYQHIRPPDGEKICTCASCLVAWNNLNLILDLSHFQAYLDRREAIPMIPRGSRSEWNTELVERHAEIVERALGSPLVYATILQTHLETILKTLVRYTRSPVLGHQPMHRHNKAAAPIPAMSTSFIATALPYIFKPVDGASGTDTFLERQGRETYDVPWHRDNYYSLLVYMPNRKWSKVEQQWMYYAHLMHERDLEGLRKWFAPKPLPGVYI